MTATPDPAPYTEPPAPPPGAFLEGPTSPPPEHLPPVAPAPTPRPPPRSRARMLVTRAVIAVVGFVLLAVIWFVVPARLLGTANNLGLHSGLSATTIALGGLLLTGLALLRYVVAPTSAYGPAAIVASLAAVGYFLYLAPYGHLSIGFMGTASAVLTYSTVLYLLAIVPLFGIAAGATALAEDLKHPGERVAIDFPAYANAV